MSFARDLSVSAVTAGFVTVLVGFASSAVIVFQAAGAVGATPAQVSSGMLALGLGMGLTCVLLSLRYRAPVVTAWSTPGAALLVTSAVGLTIEEATGAFLVSAAASPAGSNARWTASRWPSPPACWQGCCCALGSTSSSACGPASRSPSACSRPTWWRSGWPRATR